MAITDSAPLFAMGCALVGIGAGILLAGWVLRQPQGNERMRTIAGAIQEGARAYLNRQYRTVALVAVVITILLFLYKINQGSEVWQYPLAFLVGAAFSAAAGYIGMNVAVRSNMRTAQAAGQGLNRALQIAFRGGSVTGLLVVSLGLLGVSGMYILAKRPEALVPLGFGGSLISVFARLGGGIYTKAADVAADLVGKVEVGIPEDDPRNPAVIADNVGDNVGDCAGMAADLFETYAITMIAPMLLASLIFHPGNPYRDAAIVMPLLIGGVSILATILGIFVVRVNPRRGLAAAGNPGSAPPGGGRSSPGIMAAIYKGTIVTGALAALVFAYVIFLLIPKGITASPLATAQKVAVGATSNFVGPGGLFWAAFVGLAITGLIVAIPQYYTSASFRPVKLIATASQTGHATNIITGLAVSLQATALPVAVIAAGIWVAYFIGGGAYGA